MKKIKLLLLVSLIATWGNLFSQTLVVTDDPLYTTGHVSSVLDVKSTAKGFLAPRMLQSERIAIITPATGLMVYQTDGQSGFYYYTGSVWIILETGTASKYLALAGGTLTGKMNTVASASTTAGLTLPHGTAPTTPVNGDVWTTTAGIYSRINGSTIGPLAIANSNVIVQNGNSFTALTKIGTNDNNDFGFETNNQERIRIDATGNVGIATTTPAAKLDVHGNFKLGTSGSALTGILKTSVTITEANNITTAASKTKTATVTGAERNATVIVNPRTPLPNRIAIGSSYVSATNEISINFICTNGSVPLGTVIFDITVIQ